jgi:hypothetical protein
MGSSPPVPQPTNPNIVAANQQTLNTGAGQASQQGSMVNQNNAYGSLNYTQTGTSPNGTPLYTANTALSAPEQGLLNTLQGTQASAGQQGQNLIQGANYGSQSPATAIGNATSGLTGQAVAQEQQYLQPFFQPQTQQLDTQLRNQGFDPSSPAYKQAMNNLMQSQGQTETGFVAQIEPQMYQQSLQNYELPAQLGGSLANLGAPQTPNSSFVQSPQLSIQPADLTGATASYNTAQQASYQSQLAQQNAMMSGLFGLGTTALGVMGAPFTGGLSLGLLGAAPMSSVKN